MAAVYGSPVFDSSAPLARVLGHKLTNFFIQIETGQGTISDALCGFRLYPVKPCYELMKTKTIGLRMEFDPELAVKLAWKGVKIINCDTNIVYKDGGISNFRVLFDNVRISWMHTRLVTQSIWKRLISQPLSYQSQHWVDQKEKGTSLGMNFMRLLIKYGGRHIAKVLLFFIITYYFLVAKKSREASKLFFDKVAKFKGGTPQHNALDQWKHLFEFGVACLDRAICWSGQTKHFDINFINYEEVYQRSLNGQGSIFLGAHLGNIDVLRAYSKQTKRVKINVLMIKSQSKSFQSIIKKLNQDSDIEIIPIEDIQLTTSMMIQSKLQKGEMIALLGDRIISKEPGSYEELPFLGETAYFPNGPYILSYLMDCPIYTIFSVRKGASSYDVYIEKLTETLKTSRSERKETILNAMKEYVYRLEKISSEHPHQWFNFYNFWSKTS